MVGFGIGSNRSHWDLEVLLAVAAFIYIYIYSLVDSSNSRLVHVHGFFHGLTNVILSLVYI